MPGGDRTGPTGMGPMTGRGAGYCAEYSGLGFANPFLGRGYGFGRGMGLGFRGGRYGRWGAPYAGFGNTPYALPYTAPLTRQQQVDVLQDQAKYFEKTLDEIRKRIAELETGAQKK